jgi:two-component system, LuxR family, sensor kinase FixL
VDLLRAKAVLDAARDAVVSIDVAGNITHFNRAAEQMFGYTADEAIGCHVGLLMPSPYKEEHDEYVARYRRTGEPLAIGRIREVEALRKCGEVFPIELSVSEVSAGGEQIYTAIIRDVSAFRSMVTDLRRERDFSDCLIDAAPVIVLVMDPDGGIVRLNRYTEELCGYSLDEIRGQDVVELLVYEADRERVREVFTHALAGEPVRGFVNRLVTRNRNATHSATPPPTAASCAIRTIRWSGELLRDLDGKGTALLAVGEDITDRMRADDEMRKLERRARERERMADIGAIAAKLVHDLGNPLSGLSMQAQLLVRRAQNVPGDGILQPAERIVAASARLNELIRSFMDFAREQRLDLVDVDLPIMLQELVALWRPVAGEVMELKLTVNEGETRVRADDAKLRRVFDNLIRNAIEAAEARPGNVHVTIEQLAAERVRITVEDDGPGVPTGVDVFRLFETTKPSGTGIGLAVAKQIVVAHGGTITFNNCEPQGASFAVELPIQGPDR